MKPQGESVRSVWREPMVWMVFGLPAMVVVAGIATVLIALRASGDAVPDPVRRTAQIQVSNLDADRNAILAGLRGELHVDPGTSAVRIDLVGLDVVPAYPLTLQLTHPAHAASDVSIALTPAGASWHGRLPVARDQAWNVVVLAHDQRWRLIGRLQPQQSLVSLRPALAE